MSPSPSIFDHSAPSTSVELFVGNISYFCKEVDLFKLFSTVCRVQRVRIKSRLDEGRPKQYGFVEVSDLTTAHFVAKSLNCRRFQGRDLRVEITGKHFNGNISSRSDIIGSLFEVHITFSVDHLCGTNSWTPNEEFLRYLFEKEGLVVKDVAIKSYKVNPTARGFGYVAFATLCEAKKAISYLDKSCNNGCFLRCELSRYNPCSDVPMAPAFSFVPTTASESFDEDTCVSSPVTISSDPGSQFCSQGSIGDGSSVNGLSSVPHSSYLMPPMQQPMYFWATSPPPLSYSHPHYPYHQPYYGVPVNVNVNGDILSYAIPSPVSQQLHTAQQQLPMQNSIPAAQYAENNPSRGSQSSVSSVAYPPLVTLSAVCMNTGLSSSNNPVMFGPPTHLSMGQWPSMFAPQSASYSM